MNKLNDKKKCDGVSTHSHSKLRQRVISILIFIVLLSLPLLVASAASWSVWSAGNCIAQNPSYYPRGWSQLWWSGYPSNSLGKSWGWLWYYTGDRWTLKSSGYGEAGGEANSAVAYDEAAPYQWGSWTQTGAHQASFFSGTVNSYGNVFTCPP